jgi:hypothetical protein
LMPVMPQIDVTYGGDGFSSSVGPGHMSQVPDRCWAPC